MGPTWDQLIPGGSPACVSDQAMPFETTSSSRICCTLRSTLHVSSVTLACLISVSFGLEAGFNANTAYKYCALLGLDNDVGPCAGR